MIVPAVLVRRLLVEPAFHDHVEAGETEARHDTDKTPRHRLDQDRVQDGSRRHERHQRRECADVPGAHDDIGRAEAPQDHAEEVTRRDETDGKLRKACLGTGQGKQRALQAVAENEERDRKKQRRYGRECLGHDTRASLS